MKFMQLNKAIKFPVSGNGIFSGVKAVNKYRGEAMQLRSNS
jgi:hypothetical protein